MRRMKVRIYLKNDPYAPVMATCDYFCRGPNVYQAIDLVRPDNNLNWNVDDVDSFTVELS